MRRPQSFARVDSARISCPYFALAILRVVGVLGLLFGSICPSLAVLTQRQLAAAGFELPVNARLPADLTFQDAAGRSLHLLEALAGRPALILPVDFTCRALCGPALTIASAALAETGLSPGQDFLFVVIGFDGRDSAADARALAADRIATPALASTTLIMRGNAKSTQALLAAIGYRAVYDADTDQFAHPAGALVVTADGRVTQALSTLALNARDLRLALTEAGEGRIGSFTDHLILLCSQYDPVRGIYTGAITRILQAAGVLTIVLLGGFVLFLGFRHQRAGAA
jgi:protein SCO1/2